MVTHKGVQIGQAHQFRLANVGKEYAVFAAVGSLQAEAGHIDRVFIEVRPDVGQ